MEKCFLSTSSQLWEKSIWVKYRHVCTLNKMNWNDLSYCHSLNGILKSIRGEKKQPTNQPTKISKISTVYLFQLSNILKASDVIYQYIRRGGNEAGRQHGEAVYEAVLTGRVSMRAAYTSPLGRLARLSAALCTTTNLAVVSTRQKAIAKKNASTQMECLPRSMAAHVSSCRVCLSLLLEGGRNTTCVSGEQVKSAQYGGRPQGGGGEVKEHQESGGATPCHTHEKGSRVVYPK